MDPGCGVEAQVTNGAPECGNEVASVTLKLPVPAENLSKHGSGG